MIWKNGKKVEKWILPLVICGGRGILSPSRAAQGVPLVGDAVCDSLGEVDARGWSRRKRRDRKDRKDGGSVTRVFASGVSKVDFE